ncbi:MAG: hypothetical protein LKG27_04075 [Clostridiaceae bacterium]|jgi:hypothetical protein|nr:hypothetical protein [Clostridiaceae bacterium]
MGEYDKLVKLIDKEVVTLSDLRTLTDSELVASVALEKNDNKHPECKKYKVQFANEELYWVYVKEKKGFFNFF